MEVAIGIEPEFRWAVVSVSQTLECIAEGLELPDGVGVLQRGQDLGKPLTPFCCLSGAAADLFSSKTAVGDTLRVEGVT